MINYLLANKIYILLEENYKIYLFNYINTNVSIYLKNIYILILLIHIVVKLGY